MVSVVTSWLLGIVYLLLVVFVIIYVVNNTKTLKRVVDSIIQVNLEDIKRGLLLKIRMLFFFAIIMVTYYSSLGIFMCTSPFLRLTDRTKEVIFGFFTVACWLVITISALIFHPCFFTAAFQLGEIGGWVNSSQII